MHNTNQFPSISHRLLSHEFWRMKDLATTAERQAREYEARDGTRRKIKGRPARKGLLPFGESTIYAMVQRGEFPAPVKLSERVSAWRSTDLIEWMKTRNLV
ncbi:AlpA family phage regulatory protein [Acinetobacter baumannii]|uniref:helix-turn-helix transcriptional regulator n=1 Tax=Acinetobacter baumannii TaxID=470 RepID=UPI0024495A6F|nr:AlpA family phage regulatory protein [Acinetobacter baumannii]MDH2508170.1 AlpA family phage regulatory protein [Acinetobacter baumannii]